MRNIRRDDWISATKSTSCPSYLSLLNTIPDSNNYLTFNINLRQLGLISQCRVISVLNPRLIWKRQMVSFDEASGCSLCGTGEPDTIEHFWTGCIALDPLREKYFLTRRHSREILTITSFQRAINLFNYVSKAITLKNC